MGAAEQQKFSQYPYQYGDGLRGAALAQTRNGKDELITPIAFWELDAATGLYMPPGMSSNPRKPRVEATLTGSYAKGGTDVVRAIRVGSLAAFTTETVVDITDPAIIYAFQFSTNVQSGCGFGLELRNAENSLIDVAAYLDNTGASLRAISPYIHPDNIASSGHHTFENVISAAGTHMCQLKDRIGQIVAPFGFRARVSNTSESSINVGLLVIYRLMEV